MTKSNSLKKNHPLTENINPIDRLKVIQNIYGNEWLEWESPETLWQQVGLDFNLVDIDDNVLYRDEKDQIMALKTSALTDGPWQNHNIFENAGNAFNGIPVNFSASQPMSPAQCAFTVYVLKKIRPSEEFGYDVKKYIAISFFERGYVLLPEIVSFAQEELDNLGEQNDTLKSQIKEEWFKYVSKSEPRVVKNDTILNQLARLKAIDIFIKEKLNATN